MFHHSSRSGPHDDPDSSSSDAGRGAQQPGPQTLPKLPCCHDATVPCLPVISAIAIVTSTSPSSIQHRCMCLSLHRSPTLLVPNRLSLRWIPCVLEHASPVPFAFAFPSPSDSKRHSWPAESSSESSSRREGGGREVIRLPQTFVTSCTNRIRGSPGHGVNNAAFTLVLVSSSLHTQYLLSMPHLSGS